MPEVHENQELSQLVERFVMRREMLGLTPSLASPDPDDDDEGGLTDFPYVDEGQTASELLAVGMEVAAAAKGRKVWIARDGVGIRVFFGELEEVKERVDRLWKLLEVEEVQRS